MTIDTVALESVHGGVDWRYARRLGNDYGEAAAPYGMIAGAGVGGLVGAGVTGNPVGAFFGAATGSVVVGGLVRGAGHAVGIAKGAYETWNK